MNIWLHTYTLDVPFFLKNVRHTGIEIFGREYTFSMDGIMTCKPKRSSIGKYCKSYELTHVKITHSQFSEILNVLGKIYRPNTYNFVYKNCNHFCDDLFELLSGKRLFHTFMIYSRLGKLFENFKNVALCGYIDSMEISQNDKQMYVYALKLSKSIIKRNKNVTKGAPNSLTNSLHNTSPSIVPHTMPNNAQPTSQASCFNEINNEYTNRCYNQAPLYIYPYSTCPNNSCISQNVYYGENVFNNSIDCLRDEIQNSFFHSGQFRTIYSISTTGSFSMT
ncbi:hypothetical protein, conserved [Plasmodium gonderi]|uniref:PPPDE domain-containing protein n=1 Tax=Plasmodium gonderi TaxID=77519 RepID=A0A1Y1JFZ6_PLAGO|nr:hypothetical protein, conserved [Plasmodium gonderi]GAW80255.1 hypothetical protein, conserved [Plasmodium gonderi]